MEDRAEEYGLQIALMVTERAPYRNLGDLEGMDIAVRAAVHGNLLHPQDLLIVEEGLVDILELTLFFVGDFHKGPFFGKGLYQTEKK